MKPRVRLSGLLDGLLVGGLLTYKYGGYLQRHTAGRCKIYGMAGQCGSGSEAGKSFCRENGIGSGSPMPPLYRCPPRRI